MLLIRAILAFLYLPGIYAGVIPAMLWHLDPWRGSGHWAGLILIVPGFIGLLWCVRDFLVIGRGTLSPWDPPKKIVVVGLYRFVRNPMYVCIVILLTGWVLVSHSPLMLAYEVILFIGFHLRVVKHEEPRLAAQFGASWEAYRSEVGRWVPKCRKK